MSTAYFGHNYETFPFSAFTLPHVSMLAIFLLGVGLIYFFRASLRKWSTYIRILLFSGLFIFETLYHVWLYRGEAWDIAFTLPLQLCSISLILCLILLITKAKLVFQIVFFIGITGAFMALVTPELFLGYPHFRYFQFFITHIFIIWTCLFFAFVHQYVPTRQGLYQSFVFLNICAGAAYLANKWTGGNYMFLSYKPVSGSLIDYFGSYPFYILVLEAVALLFFHLLLLPFKRKEKNKLYSKYSDLK